MPYGYCPNCGKLMEVIGDEFTCLSCVINGIHVATQLAEDTCEKHNKFCCAECFDMSSVPPQAKA